ncbi:hypothetical protein RCL1_001721 [Eukaryota sp. TZLM3-RCL]
MSQQIHEEPTTELNEANDEAVGSVFTSKLYELWQSLSTLVGDSMTELQYVFDLVAPNPRNLEAEYTDCLEQINALKGHYSDSLEEIQKEKEHIAGALQHLVSSASEVLGFGN